LVPDMTTSTLSQWTLQRRYRLACERLAAPADRFPYRAHPAHDGAPHVEVSGGLYHYVVTERGAELERRTTRDADQLMFWLLADVAFNLACEFELAHRVPGQDFRRVLFAKQIELLNELDPTWGQRRAEELGRILKEHPFKDSAGT
jgi:hypothetical protein